MKEKFKKYYSNLLNRLPWVRHLVDTFKRYGECNGNFYAAGLTYYSIFTIIPVLMLLFSVVGFVFVAHPSYLSSFYNALPGSLADNEQIKMLINNAIASRGTVGIVGLVVAIFSGVGYVTNLRVALSAMWKVNSTIRNGLKGKLEDFLTFLALFVGAIGIIAIFIFSQLIVKGNVLSGVDELSPRLTFWISKFLPLLVSFLVVWLVFSGILGFLPLVKVKLLKAMLVSLFATIAYVIFLAISVFYLKRVTSGPAGAAFGPVVGLLVFLYITSRILLMMAAWLATGTEHYDLRKNNAEQIS